MNYKFTVKGEPVGKGRPRVTRGGHVFTPKKTVNYQKLIVSKYNGPDFEKKPLEVKIKAYYMHTKTTKLRKKELKLLLEENNINSDGLKRDLWKKVCDNQLIPATVKPDVDNVSKSILDALNDVAYNDDSQVIKLSIEKHRSDEPRVEIEIKEDKFDK